MKNNIFITTKLINETYAFYPREFLDFGEIFISLYIIIKYVNALQYTIRNVQIHSHCSSKILIKFIKC